MTQKDFINQTSCTTILSADPRTSLTPRESASHLSRVIPGFKTFDRPQWRSQRRSALSDTLEVIVKHLGKGVPADVQ